MNRSSTPLSDKKDMLKNNLIDKMDAELSRHFHNRMMKPSETSLNIIKAYSLKQGNAVAV
ncbi:MAG: hypothetical protein JNL95_01845 [Chitinophagales bacterium]|jgi:hypothetical protein|nr:hypothetical protein [Chitinophagales bacterium]